MMQNYDDQNYGHQNPQGNMRDIVLNPHEYCYIQDLNTGFVKVIVGPKKVTLQPTDKTVTYNASQRLFSVCTDLTESKKRFPYADEISYLILENPALSGDHPKEKMENEADVQELMYGRTINLPGPTTFALWPGQKATVVEGHRLRSNQYLLVRVINDKVAKDNFKEAVVQDAQGDVSANSLKDFKLTTGALNIIKGIDVSFYIPPTGIEVVQDEDDQYVREALTLERLQYCILVDESGNKRYMRGPDVVFPEPTEQFVKKTDGSLIYTAIELNDNMGIYVKVVDGYEEDDVTYKIGQELFVTGKEQKIYFPRVEHEIIKYEDRVIHYATAIPKGEGLYVLNKGSGEVDTEKGPKMFLPNPINKGLVKRILEEKQVNLWFPGNDEVKMYNQTLRNKRTSSEIQTSFSTMSYDTKKMGLATEYIDGGLDRSSSYTKPRMIELDTKYSGAVVINVWPGYAVQVVGKEGNREVIVGPKAVILDYDQVLEVLSMSTGRPKTDNHTEKTVYLKIKNNTITDRIKAQTKDLIDIQIELSYKVNFEGDHKCWFDVENYVKLLTDSCRSIIRNLVKKYGIEDFNTKAEDLLRDCILGESSENGRKGKSFEENGMRVYDLDILDVIIGDSHINTMLIEAQHKAVQTALDLRTMAENLKGIEARNNFEKKKIASNEATDIERNEAQKKSTQREGELKKLRNKLEVDQQDLLNNLHKEEIGREKEKADFESNVLKEKLDMEIAAFQKKFGAITPQLVQALLTLGERKFATALVENLPEATGTTGFLFGQGGTKGVVDLVAGTKLEEVVKKVISKDSSNE